MVSLDRYVCMYIHTEDERAQIEIQMSRITKEVVSCDTSLLVALLARTPNVASRHFLPSSFSVETFVRS